jgi:hypothetical protein
MIFGERFERDKYLFVSGFLSPDIARLVTDYTLLRRTFFLQIEGDGPQVADTHSVYADTLMETLLLECQPKIEILTGRKLYPTYSYYRVYKQGDELKKHRDRRSCEISVTVCLGYNYETEDPDYRWKIFIDGNALTLDAGDAVIYKGCEVEHWREVFDAGNGCWQAQVFLHYVDASQSDSKDFMYDRRPYVGAPLNTRAEEKEGA